MDRFDPPVRWAWFCAGPLLGAFVFQAEAQTECIADRHVYLNQSYEDFDQGVEPTKGGERREWGWREIARRPGCEIAAADMIATYRERNAAKLSDRERLFLMFHEGQIAASDGQYDRAIPLIEEGRTCCQGESWRIYAEAVLAFLRDDQTALLDARERLLQLPEPENWVEIQRRFKEQAGQDMKWPMNIEATNKLVECFGRRYPGGVNGDCQIDDVAARGSLEGDAAQR